MTTPFPFVALSVLTAAQLNAITTLPISAKTANYTLAVGDVGYRIQMTNAGSTTITVNTGIFAAGDTIWIQNLGAGTCTITAGTATVGTASSLALAQYGGGTLVFQSASAATFFSQQSATYGLATGGSSSSIVVGGLNYTMLTFTTDANLVVSRAGLFDCLVVGGAGGAGANTALSSFIGGGGAGGVAEQTIYLAAATYAIDIGAGGAKSSSGLTTRLVTSDLKSLSGVGGGVGGGYAGGGFERIGKAGGCGGGGLSGIGAERQEAGLGLQGFGGGTGSAGGVAGGSGGGATAAGTSGTLTVATVGGAGYDASTFRGEVASTTFYAGGGSGGGASGGGTTAGSTARATNGTANSGSGGGGNSATGSDNGGAGGSGILLVRFKV
jgi:hypothetical protein